MLALQNDIHLEIAIVGAGVFGMSTALYLANHGFLNVTVFDSNKYSETCYDHAQGCDAASADVNKILRASYGDKEEYQRLAYAARERWKEWNKKLASVPVDRRPSGLESTENLYVESGFLRLPSSPRDPLSCEERAGLSSLEKQFPEYRPQSYVINDPHELRRAEIDGWKGVIDAVNWSGAGVLDTTAGFIRADKACIWLAHLAQAAGVRFIEGKEAGKVVGLLEEASGVVHGEKRVNGVLTADGNTHGAALVIVAAGGWTPTLVPSTRKLLETTAGSVVTLKLPPRADSPDLWERFSPAHWPVIFREAAGLYSFPHLDGTIKIGYRATKFTNYAELSDGDHISIPVTAYTTPSETNIPILSLEAIKGYIRDHFPELLPFRISYTRLCWYTDSIDDNFLIDYVPGYGKSLFVASGGSGHGFKFAPILGKHVVDALQGRETDMTVLWRWRPVPEGRRNGLEEGEGGSRVLSKQKMASEEDWKIE